MRFLQVRVGRFGPLDDVSFGDPEPLGGLVAILGPNEAGKSTIHQILVSILFGFSPATRDANPYTPWDGGDIDISADIEFRDGRRLTVQRRLAGSPSGHLIHESHDVEAIANRDLTEAEHVDRRMFTEVYGVTQAQLASLGGSTWASVQDDLVTGLGAQDLRPPRAVAKQLEDTANRLWRPDARGKPRSREIEAALAQESEARRHAVDRDRELRDVRRELLTLSTTLDAARRDEEIARARRKLMREIVPLRHRLDELGRLEAELRDSEALAALPRDPSRVWKELRARVKRSEERHANLSAAGARAREAAECLDDTDWKILKRTEVLEALAGQRPVLTEWTERAIGCRKELARLDSQLVERAPRVLGGPSLLSEGNGSEGDSDLTVRIRAMDADRVSAAMERLDDARRKVAAVEAEATAAPASRAPSPTAMLGTASLLLFAAGLWIGRPVMWATAGLVLIVVVAVWAIRDRSTGRATPPDGRAEALREEVASAEADVRSTLAPLGVSQDDPIRAGVAERIEAVQSLLRDRDARRDEIGVLERNRAALEERLRSAAEAIGLPLPDDLSEALAGLHERVGQARGRGATGEQARQEAQRLEKEEAAETEELDAARAALRSLEGTVADAGGSLTEAGLAELAERRANLDHLKRLEREISDQHGSLERARTRLAELECEMQRTGTHAAEPEDIEAAETAVDELEVRIRETESRRSTLEERERGLLEWDTVDVIDGRIERLRSDLETAHREHDRLLVLARILTRAEERFRSERQPGLLRRTRDYLSRITAGRYGKVLVGDRGAQGDFMLDAGHLPEPHRIDEPLSLGTREQVYLSLRLAIAEHLDQGREPMPLLLDEVFSNWDPERRKRALALLADESRRRQVFVFTCHPHIAEEVRGMKGTVVNLSQAATTRPTRAPGPQPELDLGLDA